MSVACLERTRDATRRLQFGTVITSRWNILWLRKPRGTPLPTPVRDDNKKLKEIVIDYFQLELEQYIK